MVLLTFLLKCCLMTQQKEIIQDFILLHELTSASCQSMAHIAIYVNLHTIIRAVRPSTCNVVRIAFGHLIRAPRHFQVLGWIRFIYGLMIGMGPKFFQYHPHPQPRPEGQCHGLGSLQLKFIVVKISFPNERF